MRGCGMYKAMPTKRRCLPSSDRGVSVEQPDDPCPGRSSLWVVRREAVPGWQGLLWWLA